MTKHDTISCPVCSETAYAYAEKKPGGWMGCFCRKCVAGYKTKDPDGGWVKATEAQTQAFYDLKKVHNVDADGVICDLMQEGFAKEFGVDINFRDLV